MFLLSFLILYLGLSLLLLLLARWGRGCTHLIGGADKVEGGDERKVEGGSWARELLARWSRSMDICPA